MHADDSDHLIPEKIYAFQRKMKKEDTALQLANVHREDEEILNMIFNNYLVSVIVAMVFSFLYLQ